MLGGAGVYDRWRELLVMATYYGTLRYATCKPRSSLTQVARPIVAGCDWAGAGVVVFYVFVNRLLLEPELGCAGGRRRPRAAAAPQRCAWPKEGQVKPIS